MRFYGLDLLDLGSRRLSWRRLQSLIRHLPPDSATAFALHGDAARWGLVEQLLATVVDVLQAANWQRAGDKKAKRPKPIPRPGVKDPNERRIGGKRSYTVSEMRKILDKWGR